MSIYNRILENKDIAAMCKYVLLILATKTDVKGNCYIKEKEVFELSG